MELPDLGDHCSKPNCNKLDFLPIKCDVCSQTFCNEHYFYANHDCENAHRKNNQVPVCPLCNIPIPVPPGHIPDSVVGAHIDNDCQSDPAINKRKVFTNRCTLKGCKVKEVIPVLCTECEQNFCLKHRHPQDHKCGGKMNKALKAAMSRQNNTSGNSKNNRQMSEDEALARALALSMQESTSNKGESLTQEDLDLALARQLQASEYQGTTAGTTAAGGSRTNQSKDKCIVL